MLILLKGYGKRSGTKRKNSNPPPPSREDVSLDNLEESMNGEELEEGELEDEPTNSRPIPKSKEKSKRKFLDKIKWMKKKGKKRREDQQREIKTSPDTQKAKKSRQEATVQEKRGGRGPGGSRFLVNPFRAKEGKSITFKK